MPLFADRCLETSTSTGVGALTLAGAVTGYRSFAAGHISGELVSYALEAVDGSGAPTGEWEAGFGTLTNATTLTRHVALSSSNAGALVNLAAGTKRVWSNANAFLLSDEVVSGSVHRLNPLPNATAAPTPDGVAAQTVVGTSTARALASTNRLTRAVRVGYVSAPTAGGISGAYQLITTRSIGTGAGGGFVYRSRFGCSDAAAVSGARQFIGLSSIIAAPTNIEPNTLTSTLGVAQLSTGSNLQMVYGGTAAQTAIDLGANFPANGLSTDLYELTMISPRNVANVTVWNVERVGTAFSASGLFANGTPGTTMPANTIFLAHRAWRTNNATNLAVGLDVGSVTFYSEY